jgi:hypothetical protein
VLNNTLRPLLLAWLTNDTVLLFFNPCCHRWEEGVTTTSPFVDNGELVLVCCAGLQCLPVLPRLVKQA